MDEITLLFRRELVRKGKFDHTRDMCCPKAQTCGPAVEYPEIASFFCLAEVTDRHVRIIVILLSKSSLSHLSIS